MPLTAGTRVDRYEVIDLLGAGGMGEVYRARDPKLARLVALKILHLDSASDPSGSDGAGRILREARAAAALSHPNVLAVYDVGEVAEPEALRGLPYIAMELVLGRSLGTYVGDDSVSIDCRVSWLRDIASALGAAHEAGIIHRDVKPENVMIRADGRVKVLDFGIARRSPAAIDAWSSTEGHSLPTLGTASTEMGSATLPGTIAGTPLFMAPEQLRGEVLDGRVDQFAWGVLAYTLLTGEPPWMGRSDPIALLSQILSAHPPPLREKNPLVTVAVSDVVMRALEKNRDLRFQSMDLLIGALDAQGGGPDAPPELPPTATASKELSPRRRGGRFAAWLVFAIATVTVSGELLWRIQAAAPGRKPSMSASAGEIVPGSCSSNRDCVTQHSGAAWHCHSEKRVCVEVASAECKALVEESARPADDLVWIGSIIPSDFTDDVRAVRLAREDFAKSLGPSATRDGPLHARPIGLVQCDEPEDLLRVARHLADDVEVPAVIGFRSRSKALQTIQQVFLPKHVLSVITINQASSLTKIPQPAGEPRLIFRTMPSRQSYAAPLAHVISDVLEPAFNAQQKGAGSRPFRVAMIVQRDATPDLMEALFSLLRFNGRAAIDNDTNFRQFGLDLGDAGTTAASVVAGIVEFAPNVIVSDGPAITSVTDAIEARWRTGPRPTYLGTDSFAPEMLAFAGRDRSRRRRVLSVNNLSTTMTNAQLVLRYNQQFPDEPVTRTTAPQPPYDALYTLAYAIYAAGDGAISGSVLSQRIERLLPPGPQVDVGPTHIFDAFRTLREGGHFDLNGAVGSLDFDPQTGEALVDFSIICPGVDDHGVVTDGTDSGLIYDARVGRVLGELRCP